MSKTSTNNDIVKYIYNELEEQNTLQLNFKAITDNQVKDDISSFLKLNHIWIRVLKHLQMM